MDDRRKPIIVEETFKVPLAKVWEAITEVNQMRQWFFDNIPAFDPIEDFETQFDVRSGDRNFRHLWKLMEVVPQKRIVYTWRYEDYPGNPTVAFELMELVNKTKLILTAKGLESFPDNVPEFSRESCLGGWNYFINERLKEYLKDLKSC